MELLALLLVLSSGLTHALWNLFTKRSIHKSVFLWCIHSVTLIILMPYFLIEMSQLTLSPKVYGFILLSMTIQGGYILLLSKAYTHGDMSQVYPFMRGLGAMLTSLCSLVLFHEQISRAGVIGLSVIIISLFALSGIRAGSRRNVNVKALGYACLVGLCISGYTLTDKAILDAGVSPVLLIQLSNISYFVALIIPVLRSGQLQREWSVNWRTILLGSVLAPGSYLLFLFAMRLTPLAHIAPIREISTVFGTIFGILVLREQQGSRRIVTSALITLGIITIAVWG
ncbi:LuxR family transcriptional regulator [Paenibacillus ihbetae]|uniref:LuxR family transcriptional regulator n=1 Tax=Paenibacillus ihbetae TaxID=1870820 RepID=A0A1B2E1J1_9BACL|nr:DMT family transporter [Paenibacillus ihbetae]ANY73848.1 LuxR family transcriptional regulator [Paenibacillus ihbetae]